MNYSPPQLHILSATSTEPLFMCGQSATMMLLPHQERSCIADHYARSSHASAPIFLGSCTYLSYKSKLYATPQLIGRCGT